MAKILLVFVEKIWRPHDHSSRFILVCPRLSLRVRRLGKKVVPRKHFGHRRAFGLWPLHVKGREAEFFISCNVIGGTPKHFKFIALTTRSCSQSYIWLASSHKPKFLHQLMCHTHQSNMGMSLTYLLSHVRMSNPINPIWSWMGITSYYDP